MQFRRAQPEDASDLAEICLTADEDTFAFLLDGLAPALSVRDTVTALCRTDNTPYSFRHFTLAIDGERVLGGFNAIPSSEMSTLDNHVVAAMKGPVGLGPVAMLRWFARRIRLVARCRQTPVPTNSLLIANVAVFPPYQGHGIGRRLMCQACSAARASGLDSLCLFTWEDREDAIAFYQRVGFRIVQTVKFRPHPRLPHRGRCLLKRTVD
ncbi:MAG: GNAT family N-acetyltransferase [bacterium]|nr:GNAT family N-acetyltransferase [bacterium]